MQKSTKPQKRYFKSNRYLNLDSYTIEEVITELKDLIELGIDPKSTIQIEEAYDSWDINLYEYREETEAEKAYRLEQEERRKQMQEKYQRAQYEKLKKKFGD